MTVVTPGFIALLHEISLALFSLLALMPRCLLMDVVHRVFIDFGKPLHCVVVDQFAIIEGVLPICMLLVVQSFGPLPSCQGRVTLTPP